jgi:hypothetical protein
MFLECAVLAKADRLASGNKDLLTLGSYRRKARVNSLTPEETKDLARKAANMRWEKVRTKKRQAPEKPASIERRIPFNDILRIS